jgi:hypothetical protein
MLAVAANLITDSRAFDQLPGSRATLTSVMWGLAVYLLERDGDGSVVIAGVLGQAFEIGCCAV